MKFIPILFSTPMVQAIIDGRKTMTRRISKINNNSLEWQAAFFRAEQSQQIEYCRYQVGDVLWVRETWQHVVEHSDCDYEGYVYRADKNSSEWELSNDEWKWKPSLHMPKSAARIFLEVTNIKADRLQEITTNDAIAEGILPEPTGDNLYNNYLYRFGAKDNGYHWIGAKYSFESLWQSINGKESWDENPFVWCISFKRIEKAASWGEYMRATAGK